MWRHLGLLWHIYLVTPVATSSSLLLTPYINQGRIEEARDLSKVDPAVFLGVKSFSGFITVDEKYNSNIFFWYFPVDGKPISKTPWIVWLQGGPGASSMTGLFDEIGPFEYDLPTDKLKAREHAWTKHYSVLFIDNPLGAGFSFTNDEKGFSRNVTQSTEHLFEFLRQFMIMFKELTKAPLYIAGESYAGVYLPYLGMKIHNQTEGNEQLDVNFHGIIMGNPLLNRIATANYSMGYYKWGLIDAQGLLAAKPLQDAYIQALIDNDPQLAFELRHSLLAKLKEISQHHYTYNSLTDTDDVDLDSYTHLLKQRKIRNAIHVGSIKFTFTNETARSMLALDFMAEGGTYTAMLLNRYRVLIYCGILDLMVPCVEDTNYRRDNWQWNDLNNFIDAIRFPWVIKESRIGFVKQGGRLTETVVMNAGHLVAAEKPAELMVLVKSFIEGLSLSAHPKFVPKEENNPRLRPQAILPTYSEYVMFRDLFLIIIVANVPFLSDVFFYMLNNRLG